MAASLSLPPCGNTRVRRVNKAPCARPRPRHNKLIPIREPSLRVWLFILCLNALAGQGLSSDILFELDGAFFRTVFCQHPLLGATCDFAGVVLRDFTQVSKHFLA